MIYVEDNVLSVEITAIYENDKLLNYEMIERKEYGSEIRSYFINKRDMQAHLRDLIRGI